MFSLRSPAELLREAGCRPHHPVMIVPGFMSSGLVCRDSRVPKWRGRRLWLDVAKIVLAAEEALADLADSAPVPLDASAPSELEPNSVLPPRSSSLRQRAVEPDGEPGSPASPAAPNPATPAAAPAETIPRARAFLAHLGLQHPSLRAHPPGIRVGPLEGTQGVDFLSTTTFVAGSTYVFGPLLESFRAVGYIDGVNLDAWPYDWRLYPGDIECASTTKPPDSWFNSLIERLEEMQKDSGGRKAVILAHSMGCRLVHYLSLWAESNGLAARLDACVDKVIAMGGPFLGASKGIRSVATGDSMGLPFLTDDEQVWLARHLASPPFLFPSLPSAWSHLAPHLFPADAGDEGAYCLLKLEAHVEVRIAWVDLDAPAEPDPKAGPDVLTIELTWRGKPLRSLPAAAVYPPAAGTRLTWPAPQEFQLAAGAADRIAGDGVLRVAVYSAKRGLLGEGTVDLGSMDPLPKDGELVTPAERIALLDLQAGMTQAQRDAAEVERRRKEAAKRKEREAQAAEKAERDQKKRVEEAAKKRAKFAEWEVKEKEKVRDTLAKEAEARAWRLQQARERIPRRRAEDEERLARELEQMASKHKLELSLCETDLARAKLLRKQSEVMGKWERAAAKSREKWDRRDAADLAKAEKHKVDEDLKAAQRGAALWLALDRKKGDYRAKLEKELEQLGFTVERLASESLLVPPELQHTESFASDVSELPSSALPAKVRAQDTDISEAVESGANSPVALLVTRSDMSDTLSSAPSVVPDLEATEGSQSDATLASDRALLLDVPPTKEELRQRAREAAPVIGYVGLSATFYPADSSVYSVASPSEPGVRYAPTTTAEVLALDGALAVVNLIRDVYDADPIFGPGGKNLAARVPRALRSWHLVYGTGRRTEIGFVVRRRTKRITPGPDGQLWNRFKLDDRPYGHVGNGIVIQGGIVYETENVTQPAILSPTPGQAFRSCGDGTVALVSLLHPLTWRRHGLEVTTHELPDAEHRAMLGEERLHRHLIDMTCVYEDVKEVKLSQLERMRDRFKSLMGKH
ncbi:Lecithin:cholesterol acyltransferase-domain-containing protein [Hyaloraphidium curvatum]|nr:Lecithin:cholesterol acyltransferase-domain-containing protein [Hyaloraphidium curvatum]